MKLSISITAVLLAFAIVLTGCGGEQSAENEKPQKEQTQQNDSGLSDFEMEHGIGPITEPLDISSTIDGALVDKGKQIFEMKCEACHNMEGRMVGPPLGEVADRRSPEFIMNMILNPMEMTKEHPVAKELLQEYMTIMPFQNVAEDEARAILEYLRDYNKEN